MKKLLMFFWMALLVLPTVAAADNLTREYKDPVVRSGAVNIELWVNNEDGIYYEGESITIYFRAERDAYVAIYSIDTQGDVSLLYPLDRFDNGFIRGGEIYSIPGEYNEYQLTVSGPEGIENLQAVASDAKLEIPNWFDGAPISCDYNDDRDDFIEYINDRYFNCVQQSCPRGFDHASIYIKVARHYYKPVYTPSSWYDYPDYSQVYIDYPYGAEIYLDGIYFGIAPLWIPQVYWGYHWFTIYDQYGYCWESNIYINDYNTFYFDRHNVNPSYSTVSRYKDIRHQAKKYTRSSYIKSDQRVKSVRESSFKSRGGDNSVSGKYLKPGGNRKSVGKPGDRYKASGSKRTSDKYLKSNKSGRSGTSGKSGRSSRKSSGSYKKSGTSKSNSSGTVKKSGSGKRKSSGAVKKSTGSRKSSGSYKSSGSSGKRSSGGVSSRRSGGSHNSKSSSGGNKSRGGGKKRK